MNDRFSVKQQKSICNSVLNIIIANLLVKFGPMLTEAEKKNLFENCEVVVSKHLDNEHNTKEARKIVDNAVSKIATQKGILKKTLFDWNRKLGVFPTFKKR